MPTPTWVNRFEEALTEHCRVLGLGTVRVLQEPITGTKMIRFYVIGQRFNRLRPSERQTVVWRVADETLTDAQIDKISMIVTLTPAEFGDE